MTWSARLILAVALGFPGFIDETIAIGIIHVTRIVRLAEIVSSGAAQIHDVGAAQRTGAVRVLKIAHLTAPSGGERKKGDHDHLLSKSAVRVLEITQCAFDRAIWRKGGRKVIVQAPIGIAHVKASFVVFSLMRTLNNEHSIEARWSQ